MLFRAPRFFVAVLAGSAGLTGVAWAQYYPPSYGPPPYYAPSPYRPAPSGDVRRVPPADMEDDDLPLGSVPGDYDRPPPYRPPPGARAAPDPYAARQPSYGAPVGPGAVEREPYELPPPGPEPYRSGPMQRATPGQPEYATRPGFIDPDYGSRPSGPPSADFGSTRPPADISPPAPQQTIAALPPEDRPEVGEPKELPPQLRRQVVDYRTKEPAGTVIIDTPSTYLYLVLGNGKAMRYGIGVGREGFTWAGTQRIARMAEWPDWIPPQEMIERQPYLPRFMAGGEGNPLGARALYLGNTLYRIHGTNQPSTIGTFVSSGCIRLVNGDIEDLYRRVTVGSRVVVLPGGKQPDTAAVDRRDPAPVR